MDSLILRLQLQALDETTNIPLEKQAEEFIDSEVKKIVNLVSDAAANGKREYIYTKYDGFDLWYYLERYISRPDGYTKTKYTENTSRKYIAFDLCLALSRVFPNSSIIITHESIIIDWS
jgi:hypothetical protein